MDSGRMPACDAVFPLAGTDNASGDKYNSTRPDNTNYYPSMQRVITGNRCAHDKDNFKRPIFDGRSKRRPHVIEEAKRRIFAAIADNFRYPQLAGLFYHQDQDGKGTGRHIRSERVEGVHGLALPSLLQSLNIHRMACGHYDNQNQFRFYNYAYIENQTRQSSVRVKREMKLLQDRGIIKVTTRREQNNDGSWRTIEVKIEFTDKIFEMLELLEEFTKDRETLSIKFHEKQSRLDRNRQKKEIYRKPSFSIGSKNKKLNQSLQQQVQGIGKCTYKTPPKGRGQEIKDLYGNLISQGRTPSEAAEIIRNKYPPPH